MFRLDFLEDALEGGAKQGLKVVVLIALGLRRDSRLHLQDLLQPLQNDHHRFLDCLVAIFGGVFNHLHQSFVGGGPQVGV